MTTSVARLAPPIASTHARRWDAVDSVLSFCILAATGLYLSGLPRDLNPADESYFLYEAKRLRDGEVLYRDVFQFVTPLASYAMAALFWLFGTTMATARISMAFVHGATAILFYAVARILGCRRALALLVPLAYVALCQSAWAFASWHWFSTLTTAALLLALLTTPWASRPRWALVPGLLSGLAICVQQQRGTVVAAGAGMVFLVDALFGRRYAEPGPWRHGVVRMMWFAAGVVAVVVPVLATFAVAAGPQALYDALVRFPLENYRASYHSHWGDLADFTEHIADYTVPAVLRYSPAALIVPFVDCVRDVVRRRERTRVRALSALLALAAASTASIWYFPDLVHIAFIAGIYWVAAAYSAERALGALRAPRVASLTGGAIAVAAGAVMVVHLVRYTRLIEERYPVPHQTVFGRVDLPARWQAVLVDQIRVLLADVPSRELFSYPSYPSLYLMTGGRNPTPYQHFEANVFPRRYTTTVLRTLERRALPYVVASPFLWPKHDAVANYIRSHYHALPLPPMRDVEDLPAYWVYRRNELEPHGPPAP